MTVSNQSNVGRDIKNIDKTILKNFYNLAHSETHVRLTEATSTPKILATFSISD